MSLYRVTWTAAIGFAAATWAVAQTGANAISAVAIGHEYRQDDLPTIAAAPDGSLWAAWLSFAGDRDDVAIRRWQGGQWGTLQWVPGTSGDSWLPQIGVDSASRPWVVWSEQRDGNWDLYARSFDPSRQEWGALVRLTSDAMPDINPRMASDGKGRLAVAWQGFRGRVSSIFARTLAGDRWTPEVRVTRGEVNDWEPSAAFDSKGVLWIVYDSYRNGNYDVFVSRLTNGAPLEMPVASTPRFEARATVAVDSADRVWVAWESGAPNWGKDQGYVLRGNAPGVPLGGVREPRIRCYEGGAWKEPERPLVSAFGQGNTYQPHVFSDGRGSVWVLAKSRTNFQLPNAPGQRGYWSYRLTHADPDGWSEAVELPESRGRSSTRADATVAGSKLWLAWPGDGRVEAFYHRPLRQRVFAAAVDLPASSAGPSMRSSRDEPVEAKAGHADETGDLKAIRGYTVTINGKKSRIVRGDFHRHTELSWDGGGAQDGSLQDFYRYMIDAAAMDFGASTDHQGGQWPHWWWYTQKMTDMYHVPGGYVPIFGYERSAVFPNGHRNMFFAKRSESRVTPWHLKEGATGFRLPQGPQGDEPGIGTGELVANDTKLLYEDIRGRNGIAISHTSGTRMGTDWRDNDPQLEPVVEIYQGARSNYESMESPHWTVRGRDDGLMDRAGYQEEGQVIHAWAKGYKLGIITSSDHGSTHISYAMVYTDDPSRQGILNAIRKRHTYGAMDNIILEVRMGEHFMGDEFSMSRPLPIRVKARAPRRVAKAVIIKDGKAIYSAEPNSQNVDFEYIDRGDSSGRHYYYVRIEQDDSMLAWSSPFFVNYR